MTTTATTTATAQEEKRGVELLVTLQRALSPGRGKQAGEGKAAGAFEAALQKAVEASGGGVAVRMDPDNEELYFDEVPVTSRRYGRVLAALIAKLRARGIAELRFARALTGAEVSTFADLVHRSASGLDPVAACRKIVEGLWSTGLRGTVDLISLEQYGHASRAIKVEPAVYARLVYARLLTITSEYLEHAGDRELRRHFAWRLTKAVQNLVTISAARERELLHFVQLRGVETFLVKHAVNTAILSVLLGQRLGLPRDLLCQVGLAGLLCWSGKSRTPPPIVNKPAAQRTPAEAKEYGRHPYRALGSLFELRSVEEPLLASALVAVQFEARPGVPPRRKPLTERHPLAQVVGLCESFDGFMGARPGAAPPTPATALKAVLADKRRPFDPTLVQLFVGLVAKMGGGELMTEAPAAPTPP